METEKNEITQVSETEVTETVTEDTQIMETEEDVTNEQKGPVYPTQLSLTIRTIVGAYVIYLAYQIITSPDELTPFLWAGVILFIVAGSALVIMSVKRFILGEYEGGRRDKH